MPVPRILIVSDNPSVQRTLSRTIQEQWQVLPSLVSSEMDGSVWLNIQDQTPDQRYLIVLIHVKDAGDERLHDLLFNASLRKGLIFAFGDNLNLHDAQYLIGCGATASFPGPPNIPFMVADIKKVFKDAEEYRASSSDQK